MAQGKSVNNTVLFRRAQEVLVGGVSSPVRSFKYVDDEPILIERGGGARVYDYDGNSYLDYVLSYGALLVGHAHPAVISAVKETAGNGFSFGATHASEVRLAGLLKEAIPELDNVRFVNSGTEAVMGALRLARGHTKRDKIVKFTHSYHGHADYLLAQAGSGLATSQIPLSAGVPSDFIKHTIVVDYADAQALHDIFKEQGESIAAVILEPIGGNYGVRLPNKPFLFYVRELTKKYGALLVFDEVITGFRFSYGAMASAFGVTPDLICLGKIIGGGLPIGAYGGTRSIMESLAPLGRVYQASTFAGNPLVMQAGIATLNTIKVLEGKYDDIQEFAEKLALKIKEEALSQETEVDVQQYGGMFSVRFDEKDRFRRFHRALLDEGVYFAPSAYEANFLSFVHSLEDIDYTMNVIQKAFEALRRIR